MVKIMTRQRGFSLIEILVGLIIGLIGVVVIMQMLELSEHQKRTTLSGGDAQINGTLGLYSLSQDLRLAGYGFASANVLNCTVNVYNSARATQNFSFTAAPVVIDPPGIPTGDAGSDVIQVAYGNSNGVVEGVTLATNSSFPTIGLNNVAALSPNDFIVLSETGKACWLGQITPTTPASTSVISTAANQWNPAAGPGVTYSSAANLFDLGQAPQVYVYAVRNGNLTRCDMLNSPCEDATKATIPPDPTVWPTITAGIVGLKASYGRDTAAGSLTTGPDIPDTWDQTSVAADATDNPANACSWARIPAVAVALLARSNQYEQTAVTTTVPTYRVGAGGSFNLSGIPNWGNYRYKVFQTLIPLRNVLWMDKTGC